MAKTLLNAVNEIGKRVGMIAGDASEFASLTDSARQRGINVAIQVVNEGIDELYSASEMAMPSGQGEGTITLVAGTRAYALAAAAVRLRWPMVDKTNSQFLTYYAGGYNQMIVDDPEQDDTGLPHSAAVRETDGFLFLDRAPTSADAGRVYTYQYDKDLEMTVAADIVPFSDPVFRAMVPAWVQLWKRELRNNFDDGLFRANIGRAARLLRFRQARTHYNPRG